MKKRGCILAVIFFASIILYPESEYASLFDEIDEDSSGGELFQKECGSSGQIRLSGSHEFLFSVPYRERENFASPVFCNDLSIRYDTDSVNVVSAFEYDIPNNRLIPGENYIQLTFDRTELSGGYRLYNWGVADGMNPTDRINGRDYSDPLDTEKIPLISISAEQYLGDCSIQMVYIPVVTESFFSFDWKDKIPDSLLSDGDISFEEPNDAEKFVFAGMIEYRGQADFCLSYINNYDRFYIPEAAMSGMSLTGLSLKHQRLHQVGINIKSLVGPLGIWLEANYTIPEVSGEYLEWTGGFDVCFGPERQGYFNLQTFGKWIPDYAGSLEMGDIADYSDIGLFYEDLLMAPLQNSYSSLTTGILTKINYLLKNDEIVPVMICTFFLETDNMSSALFVRPSVKYKPMESFSVQFGFDMVQPFGDGPLADYYEGVQGSDSAYVGINVYW